MKPWWRTLVVISAACVAWALLIAISPVLAQDDTARSIEAITARIAEYQANGDAKKETDARIQLGQRFLTAGQITESIAALEAADALAQRVGEGALRARALGTLGIALSQAGLYGEALEVLQRALALFETLGDKAGFASVTLNIGTMLNELGDVDGSRRTLERALALKREIGVEKGVGSILNNLADLEQREGDLAQAETLLRQALASHQQVENHINATLAKANLARVLARRGNIDESLALGQQAQADAEAQGYLIGKLAARISQAEALLQAIKSDDQHGRQRSQYAERAGALLEGTLIDMQPLDDDGRRAEVLQLLSDVRKVQNRLPEALDFLRQSTEAKDRQQSRRNADRAKVLAARFEQERQAREIAVLREGEARNSAALGRQRSWLALLAVLLTLAATVFAIAMQRLMHQRGARAQLSRYNMELSTALEQAKLERQRAESYAQRQRRFLNLASSDMRHPLLEMRATAERALVETGQGSRLHAWSSVAQGANDLLWVAEQMLESAALPEGDGPMDGVHPVEPAALLRDLVTELSPRAMGLGHELRLHLQDGLPRIAVHIAPCRVAMRELLVILLNHAAPRVELSIRASAKAHTVRIAFITPSGHLPDWEDDGGSANNLALEWIRHAITDSGGTIGNEMEKAAERQVVMVFPEAY